MPSTLQANPRHRTLRRSLYRPRNYIAFCLEAFFGAFGMTMFSYLTVLPGYIKLLNPNGLFISLLTILTYLGNYGIMIFSCAASVNKPRVKWAYLSCTFSIRIGLAGIFISSLLIQKSASLALGVTLLSFSLYNVAMGLSNPLYTALVSRTILRGLSSFFGTYMFINAVAGVLSSQVVRILLDKLPYPLCYQVLFGVGAATAFIAVIAMALLIKELPEDSPETPLTLSQLPGTMVRFIRTNHSYRSFLLIRIFTAIGEMAMPFYIVQISALPFSTPGLVGTLSMIMLLSQALFSKFWGWLGERKGPVTILAVNCALGIFAVLLVIFAKNTLFSYLLFVLVGAIVNGINITLNLASINYATPRMMPVMSSASGLIIAPVVSLFSLAGGLLDKLFGTGAIFLVAGAGFSVAFLLALTKLKAQYCPPEQRSDR